MDSFFPIDGIKGILSVFPLRFGNPPPISSYSRRSLPKRRSDDPQPIPCTGVHPVIVLQVADDRFQTGPSGGQPLEPGSLFVRTLGLSLAGNRHPGNLIKEVASRSSLLRYPWSAASLFGRDPVAFTQSSRTSPRVAPSCRLSGYSGWATTNPLASTDRETFTPYSCLLPALFLVMQVTCGS